MNTVNCTTGALHVLGKVEKVTNKLIMMFLLFFYTIMMSQAVTGFKVHFTTQFVTAWFWIKHYFWTTSGPFRLI